MKATKMKNCSLCEKRRDCWDGKTYGDSGERGKKPYPRNNVCQSFKFDKKLEWYYR